MVYIVFIAGEVTWGKDDDGKPIKADTLVLNWYLLYSNCAQYFVQVKVSSSDDVFKKKAVVFINLSDFLCRKIYYLSWWWTNKICKYNTQYTTKVI